MQRYHLVWLIVSGISRSKLQWHFNQNMIFFFHKKALLKVVWQMVDISFQHKSVKQDASSGYSAINNYSDHIVFTIKFLLWLRTSKRDTIIKVVTIDLRGAVEAGCVSLHQASQPNGSSWDYIVADCVPGLCNSQNTFVRNSMTATRENEIIPTFILKAHQMQ